MVYKIHRHFSWYFNENKEIQLHQDISSVKRGNCNFEDSYLNFGRLYKLITIMRSLTVYIHFVTAMSRVCHENVIYIKASCHA